MKNYKYFRVLVCLLLVCALIISISPIKAHATVAGSVALVEGLQAVASILIGLGVLPGEDSAAFDSLCSDVSECLSSVGFIVNGYIEVWRLAHGLGVNYYVAQDVIEETRNFLWDTLVLSSVNSVSSNLSSTAKKMFDNARDHLYYFIAYDSSGNPYVGYSDSYAFTFNGSKIKLPEAGVGFSCWSPTYGGTLTKYSISVASASLFVKGEEQVNVSSGLSTGYVADYNLTTTSGYTDWADNSVSGDDSGVDSKVYMPVVLGQTLEDTKSKSQEQVWSAENSYVESDTDSGTVSGTVALPGWVQDGFNNLNNGLKDILSSLLSLPAALAAAIWALLPEWIQDGFYNMKTGFLDVLDSIAALPAAIWSSLPAWLRDGISEMKLGFSDILDSIASLPVAIAEALASVFVPSADYISAKVEALRGEFGFIDSVIATGEFIRDSISGASGPPVIYVDLGRAPSGNYGSQRVLLTDFSWYAAYKGQVDTVLSAALWAFFGWRVFLKLPGIIGGESGYFSDVFFPSSSGRSGSDDKKKGGKG